VYAFLFIPARVAIAGDPKRFLERAAKIQSGLLVCVYCLSFAPALLYLDLPDDVPDAHRPGMLFFFVTMSLLAEALQFIWSRTYGRHVIAPAINGTRTWEGLLGGSASTALIGMAIYRLTPFNVWQAPLVSMIIAVMGFAGAMTMSAIKRDRGVQDYGTLVEGHGGVLDRIDAICFAAPVFYHVTRQIFQPS
jgi:phosphatidate cytidylyltransferase